ncbi:MAG: fused MFS/spermidine synthase [Verrucomicrobiales bacterium]
MSSKGKNKREPAPGAAAAPVKGASAVLGIVCFFSGASVMVIEIAGNRLLAPIFGNSIYTWTALIGVILLAFSAGGYLGGWLVDRHPKPQVLGGLLVAAALMTLLIPPFNILMARAVGGMGLIAGPTLLSVALFVIPGCLLGAVTPFTIRLLSMVSGDTRIGASAGMIGMLGTLGSFLGTFASGFVLIPHFGVRQIFLFTALLLLLLGALIFLRFGVRLARGTVAMLAGLAVLGAALYAMVPERVYQGEIWSKLTFYHQIRVFEDKLGPGRTARYLQLDTTTEGAQIIETGELTVDYQHYWRLATVLGEGMERAVFLGAGAFGMPQQVARHWPQAEVEVVEIDPEVIRAGHECFRLDEYPTIESHALDARRFLARSEKKYDFIFADAYNGVRYIPAHLTTREFFEIARERLDEDGIFLMNLISGLTGSRSELFDSLYATVAEVFPNVEVFSTSPRNYVSPHNILLLAGKRDLSDFAAPSAAVADAGTRALLASRVDPAVYAGKKGRVLTDDRNPVEYIVARQLRME